MTYEIKSPLWGVKPGKRETRQRVITGAVANSGTGVTMISPYFTSIPKRQIIDLLSPTFINPSMQARDFTPFAKELIETGSVVLNDDRGRMFMWNLPPFSFEINQNAYWLSGGRQICGATDLLPMAVSGYRILLNPYILISGVTRISIKSERENLFLRLSYTSYNAVGYGRRRTVFFSKCSEYGGGGSFATNDYFSLQQTVDYSDWSATNCLQGLTLSQLLGVETWKGYENTFYIQGGGNVEYGYGSQQRTRHYTFSGLNMFQEGTTSIRARVFLPELFETVYDLPPILTTSAPIISGCIVRFVKTT